MHQNELFFANSKDENLKFIDQKLCTINQEKLGQELN
jgi:hypothetical protein